MIDYFLHCNFLYNLEVNFSPSKL